MPKHKMTINLMPTPAEDFRILARLVDGASRNNYVSNELRRMADIFEQVGVTWENMNAYLNSIPKKEK